MKKFRKLAAILMALVLGVSAGCASNTSNESEASSTSSTSSEAQSSEDEEQELPSIVRIALGSEPDNLDPMLSAATDTSAVMMNVFEGLLGFNQKGEFVPAIAESYTISDDELTYTFTLKQGVMFHNGEECTSTDVKYTYDKLAGLSGEEPLSSTISAVVQSVEAPDDYTVIIKLSEKNAGFMSKLIVSITQEGYEDNSTMPIGTGPYEFVSYTQGQKIVLKKNLNYTTTQERAPHIDEVEFVIMTDENAKLMALQSGSLDIANITSPNVDAIGDGFSIVEGPQNMVQVFALNNAVEPLNNVKVRQAINYAIDKEEIIAAVVDSSGTRVDSFLSPSMAAFYNDELEVYNLDLEKSKTLLEEAGYADGFDISVTVPSNYQTHVDTAQVIQSQLGKVGINLEIELVEWAQWLEGVYTNREYETTIIGHSGKLDPQDFLNRFESSYGNNYFNFSSAAYDELIANGASTADQEARAVYYKECQQMLIDEAASVYIQDPNVIFAVADHVQGLQIYPVTFFNLSDLTVA